jgi:hypothetical protein
MGWFLATRKCLRGVGWRLPHAEGDYGLSVEGAFGVRSVVSGRTEEEEAADKIMVKTRFYDPNQHDMTSARISSRAFLSLGMKEHGNGSG